MSEFQHPKKAKEDQQKEGQPDDTRLEVVEDGTKLANVSLEIGVAEKENFHKILDLILDDWRRRCVELWPGFESEFEQFTNLILESSNIDVAKSAVSFVNPQNAAWSYSDAQPPLPRVVEEFKESLVDGGSESILVKKLAQIIAALEAKQPLESRK